MDGEAELHKKALIRGKQPHSFATVWGRSALGMGIFFGFFMGVFWAISFGSLEAAIVGIPAGLSFGLIMGLFVAVAGGTGGTLYVEFSNEEEKDSFFSNLNIGILQMKKYEMKLKDDEFMLFQTGSGARTNLWDISVIVGEKSALIIAPKGALKKIERFV
tara:strand:- start:1071 stop:1550 length:480 start_codon:yes stop_codon:yes gene_type:complete